jgi:hypothetical protein
MNAACRYAALWACATPGVCIVMWACAVALVADDRSPAKSEQRSPASSEESNKQETVSPWQRYFRRLAGEYRMTAGDSATELKLVEAPVLKWSQPVRGGQDGAVFVWLQDGRPAAIGTFFIWPTQDGRQAVTHELHALSSVAIQGNWRDSIRWKPGKDPVTWRVLPDAPAPGDGSAKLATVARKLARRFAATTRNHEGQTRQLRLLPRPLFEYGAETKKNRWRGGALFSLVEGTDTEVLLWLEARTDGETPAWHYAFARMSDLELRVTLDDKEVWRTEFAKFGLPDVPYFCTSPELLREPPPDVPRSPESK